MLSFPNFYPSTSIKSQGREKSTYKPTIEYLAKSPNIVMPRDLPLNALCSVISFLCHFQFSFPHLNSLFRCHDDCCSVQANEPSRSSSAVDLVINFYRLLKCVTVLIYCISPLGSIIRVLQTEVLFPSTVNISSLKTTRNDVSVLQVLWTSQ